MKKLLLPDTGGKIACWLQLIGGETSSLSLFKNCFLFLFSSKYHQNNVFKSFNKFTFTCLRQQKASCASSHLSSLTDTDGLKNKSHWKPCTGNLFAITFITVFLNKIYTFPPSLVHLKQGLVTTSLKSFEFELPGH